MHCKHPSRVDLILTDRRCYTDEAYGAAQVCKFFNRAQIPYHTFYLNDGALHDYLVYIQHSPPDWTLSFVSQPPLWDVTRIPHFLWLDESFPHGVEMACGDILKVYDVVLFADLNPEAEKTVECTAAFQHTPLDVFGEHAGNNWLVRLPQTVKLHAKLPFREHFEVLQEAKIIIAKPNDPWYWQAIAANCLPLPPDEGIVTYFLTHPTERGKKIEPLKKKVQERTWENQINRLIELMQ